MCSEPGFGASVSSSPTTTGAGSSSRPSLRPRGTGPGCLLCHTCYVSAPVPLPHRTKYDGSKTEGEADLPRQMTSVTRSQHHQEGPSQARYRACHGAGQEQSWSTFIKAHWGAIAATDLFTAEVKRLRFSWTRIKGESNV